MSGNKTSSRVLEGIRIVDLTTVMMGPYATLQLAQLGADVVKIESPEGDSMRAVGPMRNPGMGYLYLHANRSKRSAVIDLKTPAGRSILHRLIETADVFVSNMRVRALAKLQLDYATLSRIKPDLVYAVANGFGAGGSYESRPAYDDLIQGLAGVPALAARASGTDEPRYAPIVLADRVTALALSNAILAALVRRDRTGGGGAVEVPMFETVVDFVMSDHLGGMTFQPAIGDAGYQRLLAPHRRPYKTSDGYICAVIYTNAHWKAFLEIIGKGEMFHTDPRFATLGERTKNIAALYALVATELEKRSTGDWMKQLNAADIPTAPMHTPESVLDDPHLNQVGFFASVPHPTEGDIVQMRRPSRWLGEDDTFGSPAPRLGEHTREILREAGLSQAEIDDLIAGGIVNQADSLEIA